YEQLVDSGAWGPKVMAQAQDLTPPTDDRPFFFYFLKSSDLWHVGKQIDQAATGNPALWILLTMAVCLVALTIGFIVLPLWLFRREVLAHGGRRTALAL